MFKAGYKIHFYKRLSFVIKENLNPGNRINRVGNQANNNVMDHKNLKI
jgi:hypothetical protein